MKAIHYLILALAALLPVVGVFYTRHINATSNECMAIFVTVVALWVITVLYVFKPHEK